MGKLFPLNDTLSSTPPRDTDWAYLAGILDGEGYFVPGINTNSFGLRVKMADPEVIDWLATTFGGMNSPGGKTMTGRDLYVWTLQRHADLQYALPRVAPFLILKRDRAEYMLELVNLLRSKPKKSTGLWPQWSAETLRLRHCIMGIH